MENSMKIVVIAVLVLAAIAGILYFGGYFGAPETATNITNGTACNAPYIVSGAGCCLDQNSNSICDANETIQNQTGTNETANITANQTASNATVFQNQTGANGTIIANATASGNRSRITHQPLIKCTKPYIKSGKVCCLDLSNDSVCDENEKCESPAILYNGVCCLDTNNDQVCDTPCDTPNIISNGICCPDLNNDSACDANATCEAPFIISNGTCCLDQNNDSVCDTPCDTPNIYFNGTCCLDLNNDSVCDINATCERPNILFNGTCCLDLNNDSVCDINATCERPNILFNGTCCLDVNNDSRCDTNLTCEKPNILFNGTCCKDLNNDSRCDMNVTSNATFVDVHAHITPDNMPLDDVLKLMKMEGIDKMVIMEPPATGSDDASEEYGIPEASEEYPDNFISLYGGEAKAMLESEADSKDISEEDSHAFGKLLEDAMETKKYRGFGEIGLRHFGHGDNEEGYDLTIPCDHPLMLIMSDIAAKYKVPIDVHMEATDETIAGLAKLLDYNENTTIIWDHAGWSNTGKATPEVLGKLMKDHPNLYSSIKLRKPETEEMAAVSILDQNGTIKKDWLKLFTDYPDRFMIGTDIKFGFGDDSNNTQLIEMHRDFLGQLPQEIAKKIGTENGGAVFGKKK
jgi:Tat protein secretion system quality control protein TatD with DNase activity